MKIFNEIFSSKEVVFISEIGLNHLGNVEKAYQLIMESSRAGADAVKFQTFVPEYMYSIYTSSLMKNGYEIESDYKNIDFFKKFILNRYEYKKLMNLAEELGLVFFSSPFDEDSVKLLEDLEVKIYKIASSEVTNHILLKRIAETKKPVIMSTGLSTEEEIAMAIDLLRNSGTPDIILMHCVSQYPLPLEMANLKRILSLKKKFNLEVGLSDHTGDCKAVEIAAVFGARIFENHFTIDKESDCPDNNISLTSYEFRSMRDSIDKILQMIGDGHISYDASEMGMAKLSRKSIFAKRFIPKGKVIEVDDIIPKRPGVGIPIYKVSEIIGKKANKNIMKDFILRMEYFE